MSSVIKSQAIEAEVPLAVSASVQAKPVARKVSLDFLRLFFALVIVGAHGHLFLDINFKLYFFTYVSGFARLTVPIFLLITGYYFAGTIRRGIWPFIRRVAALHIIWSLIYAQFWDLGDRVPALKAMFFLTFGYAHLWYLPALLGAGVILYLLRNMPAKRLLTLAIGLYFVGVAIQFGLNWELDYANLKHRNALAALPRNFLFYGFPFLAIGYLMSQSDWHERPGVLLLSALTLVSLSFVGIESWTNFTLFAAESLFEFNLTNILAAPLIFALVLRIPYTSTARWPAPLSAAIFFVHVMLLILLHDVLDIGPTALSLLVMALSIPVGFLLIKLNKWIPLL